MAVALGITATAQQVKPIANWANVVQLARGSEVRVMLVAGTTLRGFVQQVTPESLAINATTSQEVIARQDVHQVQLKLAGHRGRNTLIGLGVGTVAGFAFGAAVDAKSPPGNWFPNIGKAVFTPVGAIIGTVAGVAVPTGRWRNVYRVQ
jgi:hypothetical protein